jgi:hypothetical protein
MSRISPSALGRAIIAVEKMESEEKLRLADEIFAAQPNMLGMVLVPARLGVSSKKTGVYARDSVSLLSGDERIRLELALDY